MSLSFYVCLSFSLSLPLTHHAKPSLSQVRDAVEKGNMSDVDRREAAAQMAMKFASMMGGMGDDSDSD